MRREGRRVRDVALLVDSGGAADEEVGRDGGTVRICGDGGRGEVVCVERSW